MEIKILQLIDGARQASGLTVIIDVFRAFTVEAYFSQGQAGKIIPVSSVEQALAYRRQHPDALLCGERGGAIIKGFDYGNSPSQIAGADVAGKTIVHTTSAGTQGIANAVNAQEIIAGSLVNAKAIAEYIRQRNPETVSLVCMGLAGETRTDEDTLCATYIKSILENSPIRNLEHRIAQLKYTDGAKFFDPQQQSVFPEEDFHLSTAYDRFDFVLRLTKDPESGLDCMERVDVTYLERPVIYTKVTSGDMLSQFTRDEVLAFPWEVKGALSYGTYTEPSGSFDAALVLGGNPTVLESRAAAAAKLYHQGRCQLFIPSGGVKWETEFGYVTECDALYRYMLSMGVPESAILREAQATTTKENMSCAKTLLEKRGSLSGMRIAVVTSYYHIRRSVLLAQYYLPEAEHFGVRAEFPGDDPEHFQADPRLLAAITTECRCLWANVRQGQTPDFPILS